ncbi:unnamed protein product, partial [marine sediment metagenome]
VTQQTQYPWDGSVKITIDPERSAEFSVYVRIPGWACNEPVPSDLYSYLNQSKEEPILKVNSKTQALNMDKGFARIHRRWEKGDEIELNFPMPVRRVVSHENVKDDLGKVALSIRFTTHL